MKGAALLAILVVGVSAVALGSSSGDLLYGVFSRPQVGAVGLGSAAGSASSNTETVATAPDSRRAQMLEEFYLENVWKNDIGLFMLPGSWRSAMPHAVQTWLRCWILCAAVYYGLGMAWVYYTQFALGSLFFGPSQIPGFWDQMEQIKVASLAMPLYAVLPTVAEHFVEVGWTRAYSRVSDVGLPLFALYFALYMVSVEFFVYWAHRLLHDVSWGYRHLHYIHHKYNKEHTLSPFAGLAFHPIDGILQAVPYAFTLFYVPMHLLTFELLLFATGVWTTNIHDNIHGKVDPIMGAKYHTIHHTTYRHNYGHYFTFVDRFYGTLYTPEDYDADERAKRAADQRETEHVAEKVAAT